MGWDPPSIRVAHHAVADINEYVLADGTIVLPDDAKLTKYFDQNRAAFGDRPSYRFIDYAKELDGRTVELSWNGLWSRVRAIGARLQQVTGPGDRVAILAPHGLDYVAAFFGAVHAGRIAVPLFAPTLSGHAERLAAVLGDARPAAVLTTTTAAESVRASLRTHPVTGRPRLIAVDAVPETLASMFTEPIIGADDVAYLQYTSGSTRTPAGVEITHRAACTNVLQIILAGGLDRGTRSVSWLPLYHDMGLIMIMFPVLCGGEYLTLLDPMAFIRRPFRWIKELSAEATSGRTFAAAPNFAFELTAERGLPPEGYTVDLSNVVGLLNGSEPVTMSAIEQFTTAFAPYGLPANAVKPSYGMAEATLGVASIGRDAAASAVFLDRVQLAAGRAVVIAPETEGAVSYVSCGQPIQDCWAVITRSDGEVPDCSVGEIWLHGNNIGRGYFGREEETQRTFGNKLQSRLEDGSHADGVPDNSYWLATGDLGVYIDGEVYITGRIKDLVIIDGRNHYPHDIETTVGQASPGIRTGYVAAFSVPAGTFDSADGNSGEQLVIVAERAAGVGRADPAPIAAAARAAVSREHHVRVADVLLVAAGTIPRTTSGKLARNACRADYLAGRFNR
jgi:acyl-CoA synthetase (AMP-forming)/AMP-acid ligase II